MSQLTINNHNRDIAGLTYVYPVISRRSGGLSIGINLNPNNACNWRCIYCQVPNLKRGSAPKINLLQLETELTNLITNIIYGNFYDFYAIKPEQRTICDIAISGNGEPTTCQQFVDVIEIISKIYNKFELFKSANLILITNGSLIFRNYVQNGLINWAKLGGKVWFKFNRATSAGISLVNNTNLTIDKVLTQLKFCTALCPTWLQTCLFAIDGNPPPENEQLAYLELLATLQSWQPTIKGLLIYGLARNSYQPEAIHLSKLNKIWLEQFVNNITNKKFAVLITE